jgi:hypothetical protein
MTFRIDIDEGVWSKEVLDVLLFDRTTNRNIIWATEDYEYLGEEYHSHLEIKPGLITGINSSVIQPRVTKNKEEQDIRTKEKAEVFSPSWLCNEQNNLVDHAWFGRENIFNTSKKKGWETNDEKIEFPNLNNKTWQKYVDDKRMEITCGEAPYLVSRYDAVSGKIINLKDRIGLLDRKMRIVAENTFSEKDWLKWSRRAFESIYGFEFQGDNLLLARENILMSYIDYIDDKLHREPTEEELLTIATIISWNIWQMDGLTYSVPFQVKKEYTRQLPLFDFIDNKTEEEQACLCKIKDWRSKKTVRFLELLNQGNKNE